MARVSESLPFTPAARRLAKPTGQQRGSSTRVCHWSASGWWCPSCGSCSSFPPPQFFSRLSSVDHASAFRLGSNGIFPSVCLFFFSSYLSPFLSSFSLSFFPSSLSSFFLPSFPPTEILRACILIFTDSVRSILYPRWYILRLGHSPTGLRSVVVGRNTLLRPCCRRTDLGGSRRLQGV